MGLSQYLTTIEKNQQAMFDELLTLANTNSHSYNLKGLDQCLQHIKSLFHNKFSNITITELELDPEIYQDPKGKTQERKLGKALNIHKNNHNPEAKRVLLMGHLDTVYPIDSEFQVCKLISENILNGPGVADLKGGLLVMLMALEILEASPYAKNINWQVFINPDEEIGSPSSSKLFKDLAKHNDIALIYEPGLSDGSVAYKRKGSGTYRVSVKGKAAHVGRAFNEGISATIALAKFISQASELTSRHIINFGKIEGGGPLNIIPDWAYTDINIRIENDDEADTITSKLQFILDSISQSTGVTMELSGKLNRPAKIPDKKTKKLFEALQICAKELGQEFQAKDTGGCCDGNNLAEHGLANIDTLGVLGGKIHSKDEFMLISSLIERAKLSGLFLLKLAQGELIV